jgi:CII-binding regulator of phage lambda lysogenization HflD
MATEVIIKQARQIGKTIEQELLKSIWNKLFALENKLQDNPDIINTEEFKNEIKEVKNKVNKLHFNHEYLYSEISRLEYYFKDIPDDISID